MHIISKSRPGSAGQINRAPPRVVDETGITRAALPHAAGLRQLVHVLARQAAREWLAEADEFRQPAHLSWQQ